MKATKVNVRGEQLWAVSLGKKQGCVKRTRVFGSTKEEAEQRAEDKLAERRLHGVGLSDISPSHRALIIEWRERLNPEQMHAAFSEYQSRRGFTRLVEECVADYVASKSKQDDRGRAAWCKEQEKTVKSRFKRFVATFGKRKLGDLTPGELEDFVRGQNGSAGNYHRTIRALYGHARRHRWIAKSPFEEMGSAPDWDGEAKDLMAPAQFSRLLHVAAGFDPEHQRSEPLLAAFVLGGLAGLRTAEVLRLTWAKVDLTAGRVMLDRDTTRKRGLRGRYVELPGVALEWLRTLQAREPATRVVKLTNKNFRLARTAIATAAGIKSWSHNILRRSFASHHLPLHDDGAKTAAIMGHTSADTTFAKYRVPATQEAGKAWFALTPAKVRKGAA